MIRAILSIFASLMGADRAQATPDCWERITAELMQRRSVETFIGRFYTVVLAGYEGKNPKTGHDISVPEKAMVVFVPSDRLLEAVLKEKTSALYEQNLRALEGAVAPISAKVECEKGLEELIDKFEVKGARLEQVEIERFGTFSLRKLQSGEGYSMGFRVSPELDSTGGATDLSQGVDGIAWSDSLDEVANRIADAKKTPPYAGKNPVTGEPMSVPAGLLYASKDLSAKANDPIKVHVLFASRGVSSYSILGESKDVDPIGAWLGVGPIDRELINQRWEKGTYSIELEMDGGEFSFTVERIELK